MDAPQRPGSAVAAAWPAVVSAGLLLGSVAVLVSHVLSAGVGSSAERWSMAFGALLTCALAGAGLLGAVFLFRGTGRALLVGAAWVQAGVLGVVLVCAVVALANGSISAATGSVVLAVCTAALALAATTVRLGQRRDVAGWPAASAGRRSVLVLALAPAVLLAAGAGVAAAVAPDVPARPVPAVLDLGPATPPPAATDPGWSAEFAPNLQACAAGSMSACDDLYWESSVGDAFERYGSTCGGRVTRELEGGCVALLGATLN